jgi:peptidoglycan hydrolase-like protein with peptidoglycan-binding domain
MTRSSAPILIASFAAVGSLAAIGRLTDDGGAPTSKQVTAADAASSAGNGGSGSSLVVTDVVDGAVESAPSSTTEAPVASVAPATCSITERLRVGSDNEQVQCLEAQLIAGGYSLAAADSVFDDATAGAVQSFQAAQALEIDGIVGRQTARALGIWAGIEEGPLPAVDADCPDDGRSALVDRANQRGWLCDNGQLSYEFPITSAVSQPDPGTYDVYAKDLNASSTLTGEYSEMTHFVAFTKGKYQGARIAFHSVPTYSDGSFVQPLDSVGNLAYFGESSGCIRVLPDDAVKIWEWLDMGGQVRVIS